MDTNEKQNFFDGLGKRSRVEIAFDLPLSRYVLKYKKSSTLFSKKGRTGFFWTRDSKLYLTQEELRMARRKERIVRLINRLDSLQARNLEKTKIYSIERVQTLDLGIAEKYEKFRAMALQLVEDSTQKVTLVRMWNLSIVGAVIFGMFTMTMIYRYLGQGVSAQINDQLASQKQAASIQEQKDRKVADSDYDIDAESITKLIDDYEKYNDSEFEKKIKEMVKGYPIEKMVPEIAKKDRIVAAFVIGIAKQESDWGKHVPVYQGQDCFNYWGWRGKNAVGTGGHTCFASPQEAVETVSKRIQFLVSNKKLDTPEKMIVWKCGDCSWDNKKNMQIWVSAVSKYFKKLNTAE